MRLHEDPNVWQHLEEGRSRSRYGVCRPTGVVLQCLTNTDWWLLHRTGRGPPPVGSHRPVPLIQPPLLFCCPEAFPQLTKVRQNKLLITNLEPPAAMGRNLLCKHDHAQWNEIQIALFSILLSFQNKKLHDCFALREIITPVLKFSTDI